MLMRWSVGIEAEGDRIMELDEVVELADAVAGSGGVASGIGTNRYGARVVVFADDRDEAIEKGRAAFSEAVAKAGLPVFPIVHVEAASEDEDDDEL
jgi:hypothetical protein